MKGEVAEVPVIFIGGMRNCGSDATERGKGLTKRVFRLLEKKSPGEGRRQD